MTTSATSVRTAAGAGLDCGTGLILAVTATAAAVLVALLGLATGVLFILFGSDSARIVHVGIVTSPTDVIDAPHTGALTRFGRIGTDVIGDTRPAGKP